MDTALVPLRSFLNDPRTGSPTIPSANTAGCPSLVIFVFGRDLKVNCPRTPSGQS